MWRTGWTQTHKDLHYSVSQVLGTLWYHAHLKRQARSRNEEMGMSFEATPGPVTYFLQSALAAKHIQTAPTTWGPSIQSCTLKRTGSFKSRHQLFMGASEFIPESQGSNECDSTESGHIERMTALAAGLNGHSCWDLIGPPEKAIWVCLCGGSVLILS